MYYSSPTFIQQKIHQNAVLARGLSNLPPMIHKKIMNGDFDAVSPPELDEVAQLLQFLERQLGPEMGQFITVGKLADKISMLESGVM